MEQLLMPSIGSLMNEFLQKSKSKLMYCEIFSDWSTIVGEQIAAMTEPYKILNVASKKTLVLNVKKGNPIEIQHESLYILKLVNCFIKNEAFDKIRIVRIKKM